MSEEQLNSIGGVRRALADLLTEVAENRATLIYLG